VFPNPTQDLIHFSSKLLVEKVVIYDLFGRKVKTFTDISNNQLDINNFEKGTFAVHFLGQFDTIVKRIIIVD